MAVNKLVLIGNGFDLAHGLMTNYKDFMNWYIIDVLQKFRKTGNFSDTFMEIKSRYAGTNFLAGNPTTFEDALSLISDNDYQKLKYNSHFFQNLISQFKDSNWVNIEIYYYKLLKAYFSNPNLGNKKEKIFKLNSDFDSFIEKLTAYINSINELGVDKVEKLNFSDPNCNFKTVFEPFNRGEIKFLNFNYTDTLSIKGYTQPENIIHIHGRASDVLNNPIIFGYGDESEPTFQSIEDSGENYYLEHIKSFGYFRTDNYSKLLSYLDGNSFMVYIVGHSCGLSDRVLLREIFEHKNCIQIEIFYHAQKNSTDNFKEITQEISRHFKAENKEMMRRKVRHKNNSNFIPQNLH